MGKLGGKATAAKRTPAQRKAAASVAARARWGEKGKKKEEGAGKKKTAK